MTRSILAIAALALLAMPTALMAQRGTPTPTTPCARLAVTGDLAPGGGFRAAAGAFNPGDPAFLLIGTARGMTPVSVGGTRFVLGLDTPFFPVFMGTADRNGVASYSMRIPAGIPARLLPERLVFQAVGFSVTPRGIVPCLSALASLEAATPTRR